MNLERASGRIENLRIVEDKRNVLFGPQMREAAGLSSVIFAAAGMGGAAVQTSMSSDAADDVTLYSFEIDGVKYAGCTRKASFKDRDEIDLVFEARPFGNEVLGIRRPSTRSIWLYPYMSRGTGAAIKRGIRYWLIWSAIASVMMLFVGPGLDFLTGGRPSDFEVLMCIGAPLLLVALVGIFLSPRFLRFARAADEVFAAFGHSNPKTVDLHTTSKAYRRAHKLPYSFELWY